MHDLPIDHDARGRHHPVFHDFRKLLDLGKRDFHTFVGGGPSAIITTLGILRPDPVSKEFYLDAYYAFSSIEEIRAATGWNLKVSPTVHVVTEPSPE